MGWHAIKINEMINFIFFNIMQILIFEIYISKF